jgi:hypothetical protein
MEYISREAIHSLWREWNAMSFEDQEASILVLRNVLLQSLYTWIAVFNSLPISSFSEFLDFYSSFQL